MKMWKKPIMYEIASDPEYYGVLPKEEEERELE